MACGVLGSEHEKRDPGVAGLLDRRCLLVRYDVTICAIVDSVHGAEAAASMRSLHGQKTETALQWGHTLCIPYNTILLSNSI